MKRIFTLKSLVLSFLSLASSLFLSYVSNEFPPLSLALLAANLYVGYSPIIALLTYLLPFLLSFDIVIILSAALGGAVVFAAFMICKRFKRKPKADLLLYLAVSLLPYIFLYKSPNYVLRLIIAAATVPLSYIFISAVRAWTIKGLKHRLSSDELVSAAILYALIMVGCANVFGATVVKLFGVFVILFFSAVAPFGYGLYSSAVVAIPLCIYSSSFTPLAVFAILALVCSVFVSYSKLLSGVAVMGAEMLLFYFTNAYDKMGVASSVAVILPVAVFLFIPKSFTAKLNDTLKLYRSPNLGRAAINRTRRDLSGKLYETAAVMDEMKAALKVLRSVTVSEESVKSEAISRLTDFCCENCKHKRKCAAKDVLKVGVAERLISLGMAKGKINLVDLPKAFSDDCSSPEEFTAALNKLIEKYKTKIAEASSMDAGRDLILMQTEGLTEVIKSLAAKMSRTLEVNSPLEKQVYDNLIKCGIYASEVMALGSQGEEEIDLVVPQNATDKPYFMKAVEEKLGYNAVITARTNLSAKLSAISVGRAPRFDAAFGVAAEVKHGEKSSGDTHSVTNISEGKFLVALSDGMGSGTTAHSTSSTAISLIETFYKAGLSSKTVLSTVNKILAFNKDDNFTAIDVGIIDLFDGHADFIKIGTPYSFILTKESVKVIEGNSLPLGILDEMRPTTFKAALNDGDMIVFLSDGISDSFGSTTDMLDFLSAERATNPKTLADHILEKALILNGGIAKDDMTVFCVRLFSRR